MKSVASYYVPAPFRLLQFTAYSQGWCPEIAFMLKVSRKDNTHLALYRRSCGDTDKMAMIQSFNLSMLFHQHRHSYLSFSCKEHQHPQHHHPPHHHHHSRHDADNCEPKILILCVLLRRLSPPVLLPLSGFTLIFVVIIIGIVIIIFIVIIVSQGTIIIFIKALAWKSPLG